MHEETADIDSLYRYWRIRIFGALFYGYAFYYFTRKSLTYVQPALLAELGYSKADFGLLFSVLSVSYGISKFTSGILTDRSNPRVIMAAGLMLSGICNIAFGLTSSLWVFTILWALNGWFQGFGAPPCARLLIHWYPKSQRGRWWSIWNTSHNIGAFVVAQVVALLLISYSWRIGMLLPGIVCLAAGPLIYFQLRETPEELGLPAVEEESESSNSSEKQSTWSLLWKEVLSNPVVLMLAVSYFFVYVVRTAISDWSPAYLTETLHYSSFCAASTAGLFELGGLLGSLSAGWISDTLFGGRRTPVNFVMLAGVGCTVVSFWLAVMYGWGFPAVSIGAYTFPWSSTATEFFLPGSSALLIMASGFFIFGPQMLVGMAAAEVVDRKAAATATGFVGIFAYTGAAAAGQPLGWAIDAYGWNGFFAVLVVSTLLATACLAPLLAASRQQKKTPAFA